MSIVIKKEKCCSSKEQSEMLGIIRKREKGPLRTGNCGLMLFRCDYAGTTIVINSGIAIAGAIIGLLLSFNSRTAIAGAIIGLLLVFYNSKNLNCIGALSFFFKICSHIFIIFEVKLE